ncbi:MAG TPA: SDR family oxidoreductase [Acidobacteriaceae bacterium]
MRIFITGATGFIGTELVKELIEAGHEVRGLARSDAAAEQLQAAGAGVERGDLEDLDSLRRGATGMDAVVNLAFNHDDMSRFAHSAEVERQAVEALASVLEPGKLLVVTSGVGLAEGGGPGYLRTENDAPAQNAAIPRNPEQAARRAAERGLRVAIVRLPQVHDTRKQGLVPYLTAAAREKRVSAYLGEGQNRWAAAPLQDVSHLYRLVLEKSGPGVAVYHAVQEEGVTMRAIAEVLGKGLQVPVLSLPPEKAAEHFGWLAHFASMDMPASSEWTRRTLGWEPSGPGLIEDLTNMTY